MIGVVDLAMLLGLTASAVCVVRLVHREIAPRIGRDSRVPLQQAVLDLWLPLILIAPLSTSALRAGDNVRAIAPLALSIPAGVAMVAAGVSCLTGRMVNSAPRGRTISALALACFAGLVLMLLAVTDRLLVGVGQAIFAAAVVLMWVNAPNPEPGADAVSNALPRNENAVWVAIMFLTLGAAGQSVTMLFVQPPGLGMAGGVLAMQIVAVIALLGRSASSEASLRVGQWIAVYGILFSIGAVSLAKVLRATIPFVRGDTSEPLIQLQYGVARGFAWYGIEGAGLIMVPILLVAARGMPVTSQ